MSRQKATDKLREWAEHCTSTTVKTLLRIVADNLDGITSNTKLAEFDAQLTEARPNGEVFQVGNDLFATKDAALRYIGKHKKCVVIDENSTAVLVDDDIVIIRRLEVRCLT